MSNLDITFDNAYEYNMGNHHDVFNSDVGLRIKEGGAFLYNGRPSEEDFLYQVIGKVEGTSKDGRSIVTHVQVPNYQLSKIKRLIRDGDDCFRSSKTYTDMCFSGVSSMHFAF